MDTNTKIEFAAEFIRKFITNSVKKGKWCRSTADEQPTRENIVYPKLRKNGILAKLRGEEPCSACN